MRLTLTFKLQPEPGEDTIDGIAYRRLRDDMEEGVKHSGLRAYGITAAELRWLLDSTPVGAVIVDIETTAGVIPDATV